MFLTLNFGICVLFAELVKALIDAKADVNVITVGFLAKSKKASSISITALNIAQDNKNEEVFNVLAQGGVKGPKDLK